MECSGMSICTHNLRVGHVMYKLFLFFYVSLYTVVYTNADEPIAVGGPATLRLNQPRIYHVYKINKIPQIDGDLNESVWEKVPGISGFSSIDLRQTYYLNQTTVKAVYDENNLYLSIQAYESHIKKIKAKVEEKDSNLIFKDDTIEIYIAIPDKKGYYQFAVNSLGTQWDNYFLAKQIICEPAWNGTWQVKTKINDYSWSAEVVLPFSTFDFTTPKPGESMLFWNIARNRHIGQLECSTMNPMINSFHSPERFGKILFMGNIPDNISTQDIERKFNESYYAFLKNLIMRTAKKLASELSFAEKENITGKEKIRKRYKHLKEFHLHLKELLKKLKEKDEKLSDLNKTALQIDTLKERIEEFSYYVTESVFDN